MYKTVFVKISLLGIAILFCGCSVSKIPLDQSFGNNPEIYVLAAGEKLFSNFHGLFMDDKTAVLEGEGMTIRVENVDLPATNKSLNKIKNAYMPAGDIFPVENVVFPKPNLMLLGGEVIVNQYATTELLFEVVAPDSTMYAIIVTSAFMLDFDRAAVLVKDIVDNGLPYYVMTIRDGGVVDFIGRPLRLGNVCSWHSPHRLNCDGLGELYWSLYQSAEDADMAMQIDMAIMEASSIGVAQKAKKVPVSFEGQSITATKIVYKTEGEFNKVGYFLTARIRGKYVFCKTSFTEDQAKDKDLSPLAAKIISL